MLIREKIACQISNIKGQTRAARIAFQAIFASKPE